MRCILSNIYFSSALYMRTKRTSPLFINGTITLKLYTRIVRQIQKDPVFANYFRRNMHGNTFLLLSAKRMYMCFADNIIFMKFLNYSSLFFFIIDKAKKQSGIARTPVATPTVELQPPSFTSVYKAVNVISARVISSAVLSQTPVNPFFSGTAGS